MHWNVNISDLFDLPGSAPSSVFDVKENDDGSSSPNGLFTAYRYFNMCEYAVTFLSLLCVTIRIGKRSSCPCAACHKFVWESGGVAQLILKLVIKMRGQLHSLADCHWGKCFLSTE